MSTQEAAIVALKTCKSICSDIKCPHSSVTCTDVTSHAPGNDLMAAVLANNSPRTHT